MKLFNKKLYMTGFVGMALAVQLHGAFPDLTQYSAAGWMTTGGDDRILVGAAGTNKYHTGPLPSVAGVINRSSSTSVCPSVSGFAIAEAVYNDLLSLGDKPKKFAFVMNNIRGSIKDFIGNARCSVITTPSGTDAEMLPGLAALARHEKWGSDEEITQPLVTNIIVANGEVGTGTMLAAGMCHFSDMVPSQSTRSFVQSGGCITDVPACAVNVVGIKLRNQLAVIKPTEQLEAEIAQVLHEAITERGQIAILHMVHVSKTGLQAPSAEFVAAMKAQYGYDLIVVVDAAHARVTAETSRAWLDAGYWVFVTGSKFWGGASFSGAVLIPEDDADLLASVEKIPAGLGDYITPDDCDPKFDNLRNALPSWYNIGLALRWVAALEGPSRFYTQDPALMGHRVADWAQTARGIVRASKQATLLEDLCGYAEKSKAQIGHCNAVISFAVNKSVLEGLSDYMNVGELRKVHKLMTLNLNDYYAGFGTVEQHVAQALCLIGQPVEIATDGSYRSVLRISIAMPELLAAITPHGKRKLDRSIFYNDQAVIDKIDLIAQYWDELKDIA